ncbi:hypothetical protein [Nitrosovibrio tenuis]|uniref:Uncharacterized protein n=1 Tax=Nitrosovibrio tenuis TaxID=1233 RepID=A0A1H7FTK5_9PROT|nr:hypothetical protein [Nitrosovibrio tenuis]SEK29289.1 hypothetical protein SAMN05216387_10181 [Nitrosovibrio tenuis]
MNFNDPVTPATVLGELICYAQAQPEHSQSFSFSHLKLDSDLCPGFHDKAARILASFDKYRSITYDVQRPRKGGADMVMRYSSTANSAGNERYIAMGVISFDDFEKNGDLVPKIKGKIYEAKKDFGAQLDWYYLLLCTDDRKHGDKVRAIRAELRADTIVVVVEPPDAQSFYAMEETMIDAVSDKLLNSDDYVRRQAREQIAGIGKRKLILLLSCLVHAIEEMKNFSIADEFVIHNDHLHDFEATHPGNYVPLLEDVSAMEGHFFFRDADVEGLRIYQDSVSAIVALYYDAKVRYGHEGDDAVQYLFTFLKLSA